MFVFNSFPSSEPTTADATFTETTTIANVGSIALRQFNAAERVIVDGIRVATNWNDAVSPGGGPAAVATPTFNPTPGVIENPVSVTINCATPEANIYYTLDGTDPDQLSNSFSIPIEISQTTTIKARAYLEGLNPSSIASGAYTFMTPVSTIAELRAGVAGIPYLLTGEVFITYQQAFRNQKFVQDNTGAMLIDDAAGIITSGYEIGDGFTELKGSFTIYQGMLEFVPSSDPGDPTNFHLFTPEVITIADLNSNFEEYESEIVKIENASFADAGASFVNGTAYSITDASDALGNFRTTFFDVDYIGTVIPEGTGSIVGLCNSRDDGDFITSRFANDLAFMVVEPSNYPTGFAATATGSNIKLTWTDAVGEVIPTGYLILASDQNNIEMPVDGTSVLNDEYLSDGNGAMNVSGGVEEFSFNGLAANTYYFKIFPYCGSGMNIDFKTDGTVPETQASITMLPEPTNYPTNF
jgi:hypothetical protein